MGYTKLFDIIGNDARLKSFIQNLSSGYLDVPYIIKETLNVLDDSHPLNNIISDTNKKSMCIMMQQYFDSCWPLYIDNLELNKLLEYGKIEIYKVEAANGLRYATTNEIAQGIKGLIGEYIYPAGEEEYKKLCLLNWTFTGISYYFRQAGYTLNYDKDGKVINTFYEMIQMCAYQLKELFDWVSVVDNVDKTLKVIKKMKKSKGYKYASFEKDEITEDISIKQLVINICDIFPRNSPELKYRKALALALKAHKSKKKLLPMEVAFLREVYDMHALNANTKVEEDTELKEKCEFILQERFKGKINHNHFAYKIIDTLKKNNYSKCSPKQYDILNDAFNILSGKVKDNKDTKENKNETEIISENDIDISLENLSDAIGMGLLTEN